MKLANIEIGKDYAASRNSGTTRRVRVVGFDKIKTSGYSDRTVTAALVSFVNDDGSLQLVEQTTDRREGRNATAGQPYVAVYESRDFEHPWEVEVEERRKQAEINRRVEHNRALGDWARDLIASCGFDVADIPAFRRVVLGVEFTSQDELLRLAEFVAKHSGVVVPPRPVKEEEVTGPRPGVSQENRDRAAKDASLGVGHVWTEVQCPAYRTLDPADCTCRNKEGTAS